MKIEARGLHEIISRLGDLPDALQDELQVAVKISVRDIRERALSEHEWKSRTGMTEREGIRSSVDGLLGVVELATPNAIGLHNGRAAHVIKPRNKLVLRFPVNGKFVFAKCVNHPGNKPDPFLFNAAEKEEPAIQSRFESAVGKIIQSL
ncbi:MAG: hypothetical protein PHU36_07840 [Syntrophomonadaceae bacterium]|nr:hypothetical protein [Syntrophomonadaceae bacterium]